MTKRKWNQRGNWDLGHVEPCKSFKDVCFFLGGRETIAGYWRIVMNLPSTLTRLFWLLGRQSVEGQGRKKEGDPLTFAV